MNRRGLLKHGVLAAGAAGGILAMPAVARSQPAVIWKLASIFPKTLDVQFSTTETIARIASELTDGNFQIQIFAAGEIVPPLQILDAVQAGTVQAGHTALYYAIGKDPAFAIPTSIPFGMNQRQQNAWMYEGGGIDLCNQFLAKYNVYHLPAGNSGGQMGGWFRKEIKSLQDFVGLKFRTAGIGGEVMSRMGAVPQTIPAGEIYAALERGVIDGAEWVAPYDDERLGFVKVAPYYYLPGFTEGQSVVNAIFNLEAWNQLPRSYQEILRNACSYANVTMPAKMDARNPPALKRLVAAGAQLRAFPEEVVEAGRTASRQIMDEYAAKSPDFKILYDSYSSFLQDVYMWFSAQEIQYDNIMVKGLKKA